jgi:ABC-type antimicrobial peptide transport system, ATPase component
MSDVILQLKGIVKTFSSPGGRAIEVLKEAELTLGRGESASLRGESGSGKSTFLNIAACLENPTSGEVFWNGARVDNLGNSKQARLRAKYMGFVFQTYCLVPELNALENVLFAARIARNYNGKTIARAKEILERVGLSERIKHMPHQMSGGERQRVAIARAIINSPLLILADEPTGNLDEETGEDVMSMFLKLCAEEETALLLVTHNPDFAKRASRSLKLAHGKVL